MHRRPKSHPETLRLPVRLEPLRQRSVDIRIPGHFAFRAGGDELRLGFLVDVDGGSAQLGAFEPYPGRIACLDSQKR